MASAEDRAFFRRALESSVRIGLIFLLVVWCFQIARPFLSPVVWGIILAIATRPIYEAFCRAVGGRRGLAAAILVVGALLILLVPSVLLTTNLVQSTTELAERIDAGAVEVPPPPAGVVEWPFVGEQVHQVWLAASRNLDAALDQFHPQLKAAGRWALEAAASGGMGVLVFALSIVLAGVLLTARESAAAAAERVAERLVPERGAELVALASNTIQSVTRGILGTAFIQAFLAGIGLLAAGVPAAGLWALLVLLLAVVQLPTLIVLGPIIVWVFAAESTVVAVLFAIWSIAVGVSDNVLKPLLMGGGSGVPTLVVFIGAIGGFVRMGIIGLFVGAVVLAVGYNLFRWWLEHSSEEA
ncbi:MAG: AI-2E family transporter [Deltaproteobacteria bacterium]|jgi:predicted PurR-regulated permease PerM|nr:AI-2E family transporter [Deltaproteobacteria bacterium]